MGVFRPENSPAAVVKFDDSIAIIIDADESTAEAVFRCDGHPSDRVHRRHRVPLPDYGGLPAGKQHKDGSWTPDSVNARVDARLAELAEIQKEASK